MIVGAPLALEAPYQSEFKYNSMLHSFRANRITFQACCKCFHIFCFTCLGCKMCLAASCTAYCMSLQAQVDRRSYCAATAFCFFFGQESGHETGSVSYLCTPKNWQCAEKFPDLDASGQGCPVQGCQQGNFPGMQGQGPAWFSAQWIPQQQTFLQQNAQARAPGFGCASMSSGPRSGSFPNLGVNWELPRKHGEWPSL